MQRTAAAAARRPADRAAEETLLTRSRLLAELDTSFVVWRGFARPVGLRLVQVSDAVSAASGDTIGSEDCFSAFFRGATYAPLSQGTYSVTHPTLGRLTMFLVPVGRPGRTLTYELAVNRVAA